MKAFVTGGSGFVGSHLIEALLAEGVEVFALLRDPRKPGWLQGLPVNVLEGNLFSLPPLPRDLDTVFHLAGVAKTSREADYYTVNHLGTASLLASFESRGLKPCFVYVSTTSAGGPSSGGTLRHESDLPSPVSPYGRSKLLGEREALRRSRSLPVTVLRPGFVFGPRDKDFLTLLKIIDFGFIPLLRGIPVRASGIYIKDAVRALLRFLRPPVRSGEIYNIAASPPLELEAFSRTLAALLGRKAKAIRLSRRAAGLFTAAAGLASRIRGARQSLNSSFTREALHGDWAVDVNKAARELGFRAATPLDEALAETVAWYRLRGWLNSPTTSLPDR